jgi:quinol monooxygenase YgiN
MTTMIAFHEVEDGERWAKAWQKGPGSRHEMLAEAGVTAARTFRDPGNPNSTGLIWEVSDMEKLQAFMDTDEAKKAMAEDGLKVETLRMLVEFTP